MAYVSVTMDDGTNLSVFDSGGEGPSLLLLHGNSCDHTFFSPQIEYFAPGRRVVAPDLRGHGASAKPEGDYTLARLADDLAQVARFLELQPAAVVGHSLGGALALELSARHPELVRAVACLDSTLLTAAGRPSRIHSLLEGLKSTAWQGYFLRYFESAFESTDDPDRREAILARMLQTPQHVVVGLFEQWRTADGAAAARSCRVPMLYVAASKLRADLSRLREFCPQLMAGQVVGSGHFLTLEVPGQVNAMLERFLELNGL